MIILGIESTCDETAAALVEEPRTSRKKNPRNANVIAKSNASVTATAYLMAHDIILYRTIAKLDVIK